MGERKVSKIELIDQTKEIVSKIREKLRATQDRQKSYADTQRRPLEFDDGDHVFLKVSPLKGSLQFGQKGKLMPRFIKPFEVPLLIVWHFPQLYKECTMCFMYPTYVSI